MNRKTLILLAAFIPLVGLILTGGCQKPIGPVLPIYIPNTSTPTGSPTPLYTTGTAVPSITHTPTNSPTNSPTNTPTTIASIAYTSGTAIPSLTNTPTGSPTPINTPVSTPASVAKYLVSAPSGYDSGMPVTYKLYCLDWYTIGPVTVVDTFDPHFTYNGPYPANTANGPNFTYGSNSVTMVWPNGIAFGPSSWVTFSVVEASVPPSEYCQVRNNQAQIFWNDGTNSGSFINPYNNDSVTMVCPTVTNTPTNTPTNSPTNTTTNSPTPVATGCQTYIPSGESSYGTGSVTFSSGTVLQSYSLPQPEKLITALVEGNYASAGATIQLGIYADGGGFPTTLVYSSGPQPADSYGALMNLSSTGGLQMGGGPYWFAFSVISGSVGFINTGTSATKMTMVPGNMPPSINMALASPNPPAATGQIYLSTFFSTCP